MKKETKQGNVRIAAAKRRQNLMKQLSNGELVKPSKKFSQMQADIIILRPIFKEKGYEILTVATRHKTLGYCLDKALLDKFKGVGQ